MLSRVRSVKHFFENALSRAHRGVLVPTSSSSIHCHLPLSFSGFIKKKKNLKGKAWKENSFVNLSLQPTAAHSLGML